MIADTPASNPAAWMDELRGLVFKKDDIEYYKKKCKKASLNELLKYEVCEYIIVFDAINILNRFYPDMVKASANNVDLMAEYSSERIIKQLTLPPHVVKSAEQLQKLLNAGYDQIPAFCLLTKNNKSPSIRPDCAEWLAEHNCLSLFKEMLQHNPDYKYKYDWIYNSAIRKGSIDVAKWLHDERGMQRLFKDSVIAATQKGHLETIKWIVTELKCPIDWENVIEHAYKFWRSHKVIEYLEGKVNITLKPEIALYRLAVKGDSQGLQTALSKLTGDFPWQDVADGAARGGHADIVQWVHDKSNSVLPSSNAVECACEMSNFSVLKKVYGIDSTRVVSGYGRGKVNVLKCFLYAAMHNKSEEMEWISNNPLKDELSIASDMYPYGSDVPDEAYLRALKQIAETKGRAVVDQGMMQVAARRGHVRVFQWLHEQGRPVTAEAAMWAAGSNKVKILKAIHAIDPLLVCTVEIANAAVGSSKVWKYNVLDWMHKTCKILPDDLRSNDVKEWVEERQQK
jgi:hypothetical protein